MKAAAVNGSAGHRLVRGFDIHGGGLQIDTSYLNSTIHKNEVNNDTWVSINIQFLLNSDKSALNLLGNELLHMGYKNRDSCEYNITKRTHFLRIDGKEFKAQGSTIIKKKGNTW